MSRLTDLAATPPAIRVWRQERAASIPNAAMIGALADELYLRMIKNPERFKGLLKNLQPSSLLAYEEARELQTSAIRFDMEYLKATPHKPGSHQERRKAYRLKAPQGKSLK
jgi:hypothetical protein